MCICEQNIQQNKKEIKQVRAHLHGITCSLSCDHEKHELNGFSTTEYTTFSKDSIFDQIEDGVKEYIGLRGTMF